MICSLRKNILISFLFLSILVINQVRSQKVGRVGSSVVVVILALFVQQHVLPARVAKLEHVLLAKLVIPLRINPFVVEVGAIRRPEVNYVGQHSFLYHSKMQQYIHYMMNAGQISYSAVIQLCIHHLYCRTACCLLQEGWSIGTSTTFLSLPRRKADCRCKCSVGRDSSPLKT